MRHTTPEPHQNLADVFIVYVLLVILCNSEMGGLPSRDGIDGHRRVQDLNTSLARDRSIDRI